MKKRITSLLLALCMVLLAVPVFVLPAMAAGQAEWTTKLDLSNNWPEFDKNIPQDQVLTGDDYSWINNWSIGRITNGTYAPYTSGGNYWIACPGYQWNETGIYLKSGDIIVTAADYATAATKMAVGYNYTAEYTGKVVIDIAKDAEGLDTFRINPEAAGYIADLDGDGVEEGAHVYMAVFKNGEMVWPNQGNHVLDASKWALVGTQADFTAFELDIERNDQITFAVASNGSAKSGVFYTPSVTYKEGWSVVSDTVEDRLYTNGLNWPIYTTISGDKPLTQVDARWTLGSYNVSTHTFTDYTRSITTGGRTYGFVANSGIDKPWNTVGSIYLGSSANPVLKGGFHIGNSTEEYGAYQVKTMASATVKPYINGLQLIDAQGDSVDGTAVVKVFKDGETAATINYTVTDGVASAEFDTFSVKKGEKLTFVIVSTSAGVVSVAGSPSLQCTDITSFLKDTPAAGTSAVAVDDAELLVGSDFGLRLFAYATTDIYENREAAITLYAWSSTIPEADRTVATATKLPMTYTGDFSYSADFKGFSIRELTDDFYVQVVATEGETVIAQSDIVAQNVVTMITEQYRDEKDPTTKQLLIDMLNYAAAAQEHFKYNTDKLANAALTDDEKAVSTADEFYANFGGTNDSPDRLSHSDIGAFALILENKLSIRAYVDVSDYEKDCVILAKYGETKGEMEQANATELDDVDSFTITDIGLDEMAKIYYMKLVVAHVNEDGDEVYYFGYSMTYSVESYAARMIDTEDASLARLIRTMMQLGNTVKAMNA